MRISFRKSFARDLSKIRDRSVLRRIQQTIEAVESATALQQVSGLKKLSGTNRFYRIRLGEYRIGVAVENDLVEFVRCLHRRDIYRYFP